MNCKYCKSKTEYREFLAEMDSENLKRFDYYYCEKCGIIFNSIGDALAEISDNDGKSPFKFDSLIFQ